jgi:hypothetical protein
MPILIAPYGQSSSKKGTFDEKRYIKLKERGEEP